MGGCNVVATEHGRYSLSCTYAETVSSDKSVWCIGSLNEILLLLNVAGIWVVFYVEGSGVSSAEYHVHLVSV